MALRVQRSKVLSPIAALAGGFLVASALGATATTNAVDPSKTSAGPFGTVTIAPTVTATTCALFQEPAPGVKAGDRVLVQTPVDLEADLTGTASAQDTDGRLVVRICNVDDANTVNGAPRTWTYMVLR